MPLEVDTVLHDHFWFWKANNAKSRRSLEKLMECYYQSVGRGAVLLLNSAPATVGLIPEGDMALYQAFGKEIQRRFGKSIVEGHGEGATVELDLRRPTPVNHVISMEDISQGERVRAYRLEGLVGRQWKVLYGEGISIGHKKIDRFPTETLSRVRLVVTRSVETPIIRRLAAYHVDDGGSSPTQSAQDSLARQWTRLTVLEAGALGAEWKTWTIDLTPGIRAPGEFEFEVCGTGGEGRLEVRQVELLIAGQVIEDRVKPVVSNPCRFHIYRMEQTTADSPSAARVTARWVGPKPGPGEARIRPRAPSP
jgi:alpha-L-fucosidase